MAMTEQDRLTQKAASDPEFRKLLAGDEPIAALRAAGFPEIAGNLEANLKQIELFAKVATDPAAYGLSTSDLMTNPLASMERAGVDAYVAKVLIEEAPAPDVDESEVGGHTLTPSSPLCIAVAAGAISTFVLTPAQKLVYSLYTSRVRNLDCPWRVNC